MKNICEKQSSCSIIYDYADLDVPMLARMFERRLKGYSAIGYEIGTPS